MTIKNLIVIPVRLESIRLPGKALLEVNGKSILQHTYEQCLKSKEADHILILSPNEQICETATSFGACARTSLIDARCGTERLTDSRMCLHSEKVVSVQVDYPEIDPMLIDRVFEAIYEPYPIVSAVYLKPEKYQKKDDVSANFINNYHSLVNFNRNQLAGFVHIGIYGFTGKVLKALQLIYQADKSESYDLEQNLWLDYGLNIRGLVTEPTISINNQDDLDAFRKKLEPSQDK